MHPYIAEFIGTALVVLLGDGAVANVLLARTKGKGADLIVIVMGWAMAVFIAVYVTASFSGAHLNPVVTVSLALAGKFAWAKVPGYVAAQMLGGMAGALLVWVAYRQHFAKEGDADVKLGVFCTAPAIRSVPHNLLTEMIATFVLILGVLYLASPQADRLRNEPRARPVAASDACAAADSGQARQRLALCVDSGVRSVAGRRGGCVPVSVSARALI